MLVLALRTAGAAVETAARGGLARRSLCPPPARLAALGVLFVDHGAVTVNDPARYLSLATLLLAAVRIVLAFRTSRRSEEVSRVQAITDALTGLGNRRLLIEDLDETIAIASQADPRLVVLYDLNGFKHYNDNFGHPAGDALLTRLGQSLAAVVAPYGKAYRMGGDEFCALLTTSSDPGREVGGDDREGPCGDGLGFEIDAAFGAVLLPFDGGNGCKRSATCRSPTLRR